MPYHLGYGRIRHQENLTNGRASSHGTFGKNFQRFARHLLASQFLPSAFTFLLWSSDLMRCNASIRSTWQPIPMVYTWTFAPFQPGGEFFLSATGLKTTRRFAFRASRDIVNLWHA
jgi:hypothetical protein